MDINVKKCITHERWRQSHSAVTREIKITRHNSAVEANTSSSAGTSSEVKISLTFLRWNVPIITWGNRTLIFHLPLRLVSHCFLAAPRSQSVRGWSVRLAEFLSDGGTTEEFKLLPSLFPVWQSANALQQMFTPIHSSSVCSVVPSVQVVTVELLVWLTGSWHVRVQDTKHLDL